MQARKVTIKFQGQSIITCYLPVKKRVRFTDDHLEDVCFFSKKSATNTINKSDQNENEQANEEKFGNKV